jgi:hypothetical protein
LKSTPGQVQTLNFHLAYHQELPSIVHVMKQPVLWRVASCHWPIFFEDACCIKHCYFSLWLNIVTCGTVTKWFNLDTWQLWVIVEETTYKWTLNMLYRITADLRCCPHLKQIFQFVYHINQPLVRHLELKQKKSCMLVCKAWIQSSDVLNHRSAHYRLTHATYLFGTFSRWKSWTSINGKSVNLFIDSVSV